MAQQGYGLINGIADPIVRNLLQAAFDQVRDLQTQVAALQANALQRGSPVSAEARIMNVFDPVAAKDAVNLQTLRRVIRSLSRGEQPTPTTTGIPGDPNTIPSDALPLPAHEATVAAVFAANPGFVATSCQSAPGGTWDLMDAIVDALRALDTRWGYNGKRGVATDPSQDALAYDYDPLGPGGEGSTTVYIVDVISGHCGPNPSAAFQDVTIFAPGVWIGRGRF